MKKIITTLIVIVAAALGAQGQTTVTFPSTGTNSFSSLTFETKFTDIAPDAYNDVKLLFATTGFVYADEFSRVTITNITLSGQGLADNTAGFNSFNITANTLNTTNSGFFVASLPVSLATNISTWNANNNILNFQADFRLGATAPPGAKIYYAVQYSVGGNQINTAFGNVNLVAVPEPSTYLAAAGLVGLCLWSARRQLYKLAGSRSTSSGSGSNGAA